MVEALIAQPADKYATLRRAVQLARNRAAWEAARLDSVHASRGVLPPARVSARMMAHAGYTVDAPPPTPPALRNALGSGPGGAGAGAAAHGAEVAAMIAQQWRDYVDGTIRSLDREGVRFMDDPDDADDATQTNHPLARLKDASSPPWNLDWF